MKTIHRHSPARGFTLTELLVVITIIAVLASLSLMMFTRMRTVADRASATKSLSALQMANTLYASEHNGNYISHSLNDESGNRAQIPWWFQNTEFLAYFRGQVTQTSGNGSRAIPVDMLDPVVLRAKQSKFDRIYASYGINIHGLPAMGGGKIKNGGVNYTTNTVKRPSESMAFASSSDLSIRYNSRFKWDGQEGKKSDSRIAYRHNNKAIVAYFDGHVGEVSKADMEEIDRTRGGSQSAFWKPNR